MSKHAPSFVYSPTACLFAWKSPGYPNGNYESSQDCGLWIYLVCAPCRCSRIRGRSPGKVEADPVPCVAFYPCPVSGTTPGHWGSSAHTWSPPGDVHIRCCWWRRSAFNMKRWFKRASTGARLWVRVRLAESFSRLSSIDLWSTPSSFSSGFPNLHNPFTRMLTN